MLRSTFATTVALAIAAALLGGCGKSAPTTSSYSQLAHVANQPVAPAQPIAQGYDPSTAAGSSTSSTATGALLLAVSSLKDASGTVDSVDVSLTGSGLAQPLEKRLTAADLQSSNTLDFEHIPAGTLTATLTAMDKTGATLGTKTTTVAVTPTGQTKLQLQLTASPFSFTVGAAPATNATTTPDQTGTGATSGGDASGTVDNGTGAAVGDGSALAVEIVNKQVVRKFLLFKRLSVTVRVTNHNTTETLNGQVIVDFHATKGIISKQDTVVETLTAPVTALAPGKSVDITLQSTKSASDAEATVHTVLASSSASTQE